MTTQKINKLLLRTLEELCADGFVISGSLGLFLLGYDIRGGVYKDIDLLVTPTDLQYRIAGRYQQYIIERDDITNQSSSGSGSDFYCHIKYYGITFEILKSMQVIKQQIKYKGYTLQVQKFELIMDAKLRYSLQGLVKHAQDILKISKIIKHKPKASAKKVLRAAPPRKDNWGTDDLPF